LDKNLVAYQLQEAVVNSFPGWKFANNTSAIINLKLNILFQLSGRAIERDDKVKNHIAFNQDNITIKVIAANIIPNLVE
jgi:hypothetical protein